MPRPARRYPRFWIWRPLPGHQWDFNPPDLGAAQHTLRTSPPPQGARPVPHGRPVGHPSPRHGASRVACVSLVYMLSPLPRRSDWGYCFAHYPSRISLPRNDDRVGLHDDLFEVCSAFTHVTACTLAESPKVIRYIKGFSYFVTSITAPIASGWNDSRAGLSPTGKTPP